MELGLALSGGGIRAAVFHLGVCRRLADEKLLEAITQLSTVSGGSLAAALIFTEAGLAWPKSSAYSRQIFPALKRRLTTTDLFSTRAIGATGLFRFNGRLLNDRAFVLARMLETRWRVFGLLGDLPDQPIWSINATTLETGKNWRFSKREMGDWQFGCHYNPPFSIAEAVAASAAVPYVIGAMKFNLPENGWYTTDPATRRPLRKRQAPPCNVVHLWDGGAYENLGLEAVFKPREGLVGCDFLICSDASAPVRMMKLSLASLLRGRLSAPRLFDISSDQIRALRTRMLVQALQERKIRGALVRMGNSVRDIDIKAGRLRDDTSYDKFQTDQETSLASMHPTDLKALPEQAFDRIARHGYEVTDATLSAYHATLCPSRI